MGTWVCHGLSLNRGTCGFRTSSLGIARDVPGAWMPWTLPEVLLRRCVFYLPRLKSDTARARAREAIDPDQSSIWGRQKDVVVGGLRRLRPCEFYTF